MRTYGSHFPERGDLKSWKSQIFLDREQPQAGIRLRAVEITTGDEVLRVGTDEPEELTRALEQVLAS